jgi:hypothetical protein
VNQPHIDPPGTRPVTLGIRTVSQEQPLREPNILLDALIDEAGMSHDGFASRVNQAGKRHGLALLYDHASVRRWIRDATVPRGQVPELICEILSARLQRAVTLSDAGLDHGASADDGTPLAQAVDAAAALWRSDRKQAAGLQSAKPIQGPAAIAPLYEWENPPDDLHVARHADRRVGREQVRALQAARIRYEHMYREVGGVPVRPRIVDFLASCATPLVKGAYDDDTGRDLYRAAGGLAALAGICAYDADLQGAAQRYYFQALRMAKASGDRGFGGYVIALLANQALYQGRNRQVIQYAETALRGARGRLSSALITDLYALQAKAYARIGDRDGCHASMTRAEDAASRIRLDRRPHLRPAVRRRRRTQPCPGARPPARHPRHHPGRAEGRRARRRYRHADARPGSRHGIPSHRGAHRRRP